MVKTESREFVDEQGTVTVKCTQLPATRAFRLMNRLGKLVGPALGQLKGIKFKTDASALLPALSALFETMEPDQADALMTSLLEGCLVSNGQSAVAMDSPASIDRVFSGRFLTLLKVMIFSVEVNFSDFFRGLAPASAEKLAPASA